MITAATVKELRDKTNAGMMDCKKALEEAGGNMEQAVEILRKKGMAMAKKKESREAKEGVLGHFCDEAGTLAGLVEINCETDFVIKTDDFQKFVAEVTKIVREKNPGNLQELLTLPLSHERTVQEMLTAVVAKIGENIQIRRFVRWQAASPEEKIGFYLHAGSKIGVLVRLKDPQRKLDTSAAKEIAMHIAAMHPKYVRPDQVPAEMLAKEKEILMATIDAKKPKEIQEKIVEGKLQKFYTEECLENQIFVKDPEGKKRVKDWLKGVSPTGEIKEFVRLQVGA